MVTTNLKALGRLLWLTLALTILSITPLGATESVDTLTTDSVASSHAGINSEWVHTRGNDPIAAMKGVWRDINLRRCLDDYLVVEAQVTDSLEANKEPDETVRFYQPTLYSISLMVNYQKFHAEGYSPRLTIYFYGAAVLFLLMLIGWLIKIYIVSPFKK